MKNHPSKTHLTNKEISRMVGTRLVELRKTLSNHSGRQWTQGDLAQAIESQQVAISRMEKGSGSMGVLIRMLNFYDEMGLNIGWVISLDNRGISKTVPMQPYQHPERTKTIRILHHVQESISSIIKDLA